MIRPLVLGAMSAMCFSMSSFASAQAPERLSSVAHRTAKAPTIDGKLDEPAWTIREPVVREAIGIHNNAVQFGTLWDDDALYVGVAVADASLNVDGPKTWECDSVEIYVDGNHSEGVAYDAHDCDLVLVLKGARVEKNGLGVEAPGVRGAWASTEKGYSMEFAIPWTMLDVTPKSGAVIGFDVSNNDNDGKGKRDSKLMWSTPNDDAWKDTSKFGDLTLSDK